MNRAIGFASLLLATLSKAQMITVGKYPLGLKFSENGKCLAISCTDHIYVRNIIRSRTYRFPSGDLCDISPGGTRVAIRDPQKEKLTIWDVARTKPIRVWQYATADATFSPDGREVLFLSENQKQPLEKMGNLKLVRLDIRTGNLRIYSHWSQTLSKFMANWFKEQRTAVTPEDVRYAAVYQPMRWRKGDVIQTAVGADSPHAITFVAFTMDLHDQKPVRILPGFGLYYLWNGDYLWKDGSVGSAGNPPMEWFAVWHNGRSHKLLDEPDFVTEPAPSGDAGAYPGVCTSSTPWVAFYGIRNIAQQVDEPYTWRQLRRQRLIIELVNVKTKRKVVLVKRHYNRMFMAAALSPDAKWVAYTSDLGGNKIELQKVRL